MEQTSTPTIGSGLETTRGRARFLALVLFAAIACAAMVLTPGTSAIYQNEAAVAASKQMAHVAYVSDHTGMHSNLFAIPATGPVVFWDGSAVMCSALVTSKDGSGSPASLVSEGNFSCDWSTLQAHPASVDSMFQKQLDVRVGLVGGHRAAAALIHAAVPWFATSVQPAH